VTENVWYECLYFGLYQGCKWTDSFFCIYFLTLMSDLHTVWSVPIHRLFESFTHSRWRRCSGLAANSIYSARRAVTSAAFVHERLPWDPADWLYMSVLSPLVLCHSSDLHAVVWLVILILLSGVIKLTTGCQMWYPDESCSQNLLKNSVL
jgi:hypothetical protein